MTRAWAIAPGAWAGGCALAVLLVCPISVAAQSTPIAHGTVHLVTQENMLEPGREAWIGVLFALDQGWHIYWINPGDAGEPPTIQWTLPPGFQAGAIRWPRPLRLKTGPLIDYGYEGRTLLPVPMQVPSSYQVGARVTLSADVRYFVCREVCIPARAHVTLTLPPGAGAADAAATRELFRKAHDASPKPMPVAWRVEATQTDNQIVLAVQSGTAEAEAMFFPIDRDQIDNGAPQAVRPMTGGVRITLRRSALADKPVSVLRGVVVLGGDRAFEITVPVSARR